ncbi:Asp-tRNA(Asn)/Glu-tRNA(Gln) amidotransferase subunit GatB [Candidatus Saccharibacteria bacterium]|nr:Asp-tRNA(Asn)/Glu-tRNA(Gln) amidotransferase subunit GatB [Candidatus Saccharibacteria bacterium]
MVRPEIRSGYRVTIGIECHVQLKTKTKLFSAVGNDAREAPANTLISHIDLGMPGALPVLNEAAVVLASRAAFALGTKPQPFSKFDRKHYFYPDLPNGYQITQFYDPIIKGGVVTFDVAGEQRQVRIHEAHLEADAGKSTHPVGRDYSLVDLNRAGTPLLEIVSEPDIHSSEDARAYARELYLLVRYADVSDASLYYGNMRFDVNVSVSKTDELGTRTETKNLNSFRSVEKAAEYEIDRQIALLESGEAVVQETRGWDDSKQETFSQRGKEEAHDYRYMPDPDLPPIVLSDDMIAEFQKSMPLLPNIYRDVLKHLGLDLATIETLIDSPANTKLVKNVLDESDAQHAKRVANWLVNVSTEDDDDSQQSDNRVSAEAAIKLSKMVSDNKLSSTSAKEIWQEILVQGGDPEALAQSKNLLQVSDQGEIASIVQAVLAENPKAAEDIKNGEMKAIGFLVGQVMKQSKGKANPTLAQAVIKAQLGL